MTMIEVYLRALPSVLPMGAAAVLGALVVAPVLARRWEVPVVLVGGWALAALVPLAGLLAPGHWQAAGSTDRISGFLPQGRPHLVGPAELLTASEPSLNVWLFVPLGVATVLVVAAGAPVVLVALAPVVPFVGEALQGLVPELGRAGFLWDDVSANWQGLALGALVAAPGAVAVVAACHQRVRDRWARAV